MASRAQLAARSVLPALPDGEFGVPDPDDPSTVTLWRVDRGRMTAWPPGRRWAPRPPAGTRDMPVEERRERRELWYRQVYWPWKAAVVAEIARAPRTCTGLFESVVPPQERPDVVLADLLAARKQRAEERRRREQARRDTLLTCAVLAAAGLSYRRIGRGLGVPSSTAHVWAKRGAELWKQEEAPDALRAALAALPPLDDLRAVTNAPKVADGRTAPSDADEGFAEWAVRHVGVDPGKLDAALTGAIVGGRGFDMSLDAVERHLNGPARS